MSGLRWRREDERGRRVRHVRTELVSRRPVLTLYEGSKGNGLSLVWTCWRILHPQVGGVSEYGEYEVVGRREYRGHKPGTRFEALMTAATQRAVDRRDIRLIRFFTPDLQEGSWTLPDPWPPGQPTVPPAPTETPHGVSLIEGGG